MEAFMFLVQQYKDLNVQDADGNTPLHTAVAVENEEAIKTLISSGVDFNVKDKEGETAYDAASSKLKKLFPDK
jgi:ankyrin repeat protein